MVDSSAVPENCEFYWKILNRGPEAEHRDEIRGQIIEDDGSLEKQEQTSFAGNHVVECYAVHRGVVVARGGTVVPIKWQEAEAA